MKFRTLPAESQCLGKEAFATYKLAHSVAKRPRYNRNDRMEAYHCGHCGKWHIGHRVRTKRLKDIGAQE